MLAKHIKERNLKSTSQTMYQTFNIFGFSKEHLPLALYLTAKYVNEIVYHFVINY